MPPFPTRVRAALYGALAVRFTASEDHTESPWGKGKAARAREATEAVVGIGESVGPIVPRRWLLDHLDGILNYCRTKVPGFSQSRKRKYQVTAAPRPCL